MSYVVHIRRDLPFTEQELIAAIDGDKHFSIDPTDDPANATLVLQWVKEAGSRPEYFVLDSGVIDITSPTNAAMQAAQTLATSLGAQILGEEGEDLTGVDIHDDEMVGCGPFMWAILGIGALLAIYWLVE